MKASDIRDLKKAEVALHSRLKHGGGVRVGVKPTTLNPETRKPKQPGNPEPLNTAPEALKTLNPPQDTLHSGCF